MPLSMTDFAADLSLLSEPLIPLPDELLLLPLPVPIPSPEGQLPVEPITLVDLSPLALSREGPFVASCDTGGHLLIPGLPGCPYRKTKYREEDVAHIDPTFGVQLRHPRFLECVGAPESARLLGRSPAEWLQVIDCQDVLGTALELQYDAGLMVTSLHRID